MKNFYQVLGLQLNSIVNFLSELPAASSYAIYR